MRSLLKILLISLALSTAPQVLAGKLDLHDLSGLAHGAAIADGRDARNLRIAQSNGPSLSEAVEMVRQQCKCRIVSAETKISGNREVHHIKALTEDGKVKTFTIQGRSKQS
jgi:hypothetical protein